MSSLLPLILNRHNFYENEGCRGGNGGAIYVAVKELKSIR